MPKESGTAELEDHKMAFLSAENKRKAKTKIVNLDYIGEFNLICFNLNFICFTCLFMWDIVCNLIFSFFVMPL